MIHLFSVQNFLEDKMLLNHNSEIKQFIITGNIDRHSST